MLEASELCRETLQPEAILRVNSFRESPHGDKPFITTRRKEILRRLQSGIAVDAGALAEAASPMKRRGRPDGFVARVSCAAQWKALSGNA